MMSRDIGKYVVISFLIVLCSVGVFMRREQMLFFRFGDTFSKINTDVLSATTWETNGNDLPLSGTLYTIVITNNSMRELLDWSIRVNIKQKCYISNALAGKIDIIQFRDEKKNVMLGVDLNYISPRDWKRLPLTYLPNEQGVTLIELNPGDCIIYHPDPLEEQLIAPKTSSGKTASKNIRLVFYSQDMGVPVDFSDSIVNYKYRWGVIDDPVTFILFGILFFLFAELIFAMRKSKIEKQHERDTLHQKKTIEEVMGVFTKFIDAKDPYTGGHSERVGKYARMIAEELGYSKEMCQKTYYCGILHDSGKIAISEDILRKPGHLSDEEFEEIQTHTLKGYDLLRELPSIPEASDTARYHHEKFDGSGYPYGLRGNDIPEISRIVTVADSFDSMNTDRYYRKRLSKEVILDEFNRQAGYQFDPKIAKCLVNLIKSGKIQI